MIMCHKGMGYDLNVKQQSTCIVINLITVDNVVALLNYMPLDRASDSMVAPI